MKTPLLLAITTLAVAPAFAQLAAPNAAGVAIGHIHLNASDVDTQVKFWTQVGGKNVPITLIERKPGSGTRFAFDKCVMGSVPESTTPAAQEDSTQLVMQAVSSQPGAISYVGTASLAGASNVTAVKLNGANPDGASVASGAYHFFAHEHMYTRKSPAPPPLAQDYIAFILAPGYQSGAVVQSGFYPLSTTTRQSAADL